MNVVKTRYGGIEPTKRRKFRMSNISRLADPVIGNDRDAALSPRAASQRKAAQQRLVDGQAFEQVRVVCVCVCVVGRQGVGRGRGRPGGGGPGGPFDRSTAPT